MVVKVMSLVMLVALACFGCRSGQTTSAPGSGAGGAGAAMSAAAASGGGHTEMSITDPTLDNLTAFRISIPANWKFQGMVFQPGQCVKFPAPVFRATSPDGLSFSEQMPPFGWVWGSGPRVATEKTRDCLPMGEGTSAQKLLDYVADTLHLGPASPVDSSQMNAQAQQELATAEARSAQGWANMRVQPPKKTVEVARAQVTYKNGPVTMKGMLTTAVNCLETSYPGMHSILRGMADTPPSIVDHCEALVDYTSAPENQFDVVLKKWMAPGMGGHGGENEWFTAYVKRGNAQNSQFIDRQTTAFKLREAADQEAYNARFQMQKQFQQAMADSTASSMKNAHDATEARTTAASDMVDFALDNRTVVNPGTGAITKVSNQATTAWQNSAGVTYWAKDPTFDPNKAFSGSWSQVPFTHGNGTPQ